MIRMRKGFCLVLAVAALALAGCAAGPPDPVRVVDSPADTFSCRSLGRVGEPVATSGEAITLRGLPANTTLIPFAGLRTYGPAGGGDNFALHVDALRAAVIERGGNTLRLARRVLRNWSYVEGLAYRCPDGAGSSEPLRLRY